MKGSLTVELSLLFPLLFIIFMFILQCSLYLFYRLYTQCLVQQSFMVCIEQRKAGESPELSMEGAREYLLEKTAALPLRIEKESWNQEDAWFKESYEVEIVLQYMALIPLSWTVQGKTVWSDPLQFKNRVDFLWETGKVLLENNR